MARVHSDPDEGEADLGRQRVEVLARDLCVGPQNLLTVLHIDGVGQQRILS